LQLAAATKHLYEQHKRENADRCLPALGTPLAANSRVEHRGSRTQFKVLEEFMKMRIVVSLLAFLSLCGAAAEAQETPKVDVFAGYSYVRENPGPRSGDSFSLNGGSASVTYHIKDWISGVADFGGYHNGNILGSGVDGTLSTYLFGPRVSYRSFRHFTPFAEALFGVAHAGASIAGGANGSQNSFAMAIGGGVDYRINTRFSLRPLQVDYLMTQFPEGTPNNQTQNNLRASTGIVIHF
jgi:outer membrane immunogenic protein